MVDRKKILITGKRSYIGSSLINWLNKWPEMYESIDISVRGDEWETYDFSMYDVLIHVAGVVHKKEKKKMEKMYFDINTDLTIKLAKKAKKEGIRQFIFISTMAVYGLEGELKRKLVIDEQTICKPKTYYGKSKLLAEMQLKQLEEENFKVVILRPPMIYGEGCKGNYQHLKKLISVLPVFPNIKNERSMINIDNFSEFIKISVDNNIRGTYFPQDSEYVSTKSLVDILAIENAQKVYYISLFNPIIIKLGGKITLLRKIFGNLVYDKSMSKKFENQYIKTNDRRVVKKI
jgi:nucleoside-diphosphate-sugar epimerase